MLFHRCCKRNIVLIICELLISFLSIHTTRSAIFTNAADVIDEEDSSRVVNRQLAASITTSEWPTSSTSPLCEAFSFLDSFINHQNDGNKVNDNDNDTIGNSDDERRDFYLNWKLEYLSSLTTKNDNIQNEIIDSYEKGMRIAVETTFQSNPDFKTHMNNSRSSLESNLLSFSLATRAHAPQCEMYRSLSSQVLSKFDEDHGKLKSFVIVHGWNDIIYTSIQELNSSLEKDIQTSKAKNGVLEGDDNDDVDVDAWAMLLPNEQVFNGKDSIDEAPIFILYGQFDSQEFAAFFHHFKENNLPFVVRFMGDATYNQDSSSTKTTLQGYGVRVDIRNLEYKSFDEKESIKSNETQPSTSSDDDNETTDQSSKYIKESLNINFLKEKWINGIDPEFLSSHSTNDQMIQFIEQYLPHLKPPQYLENYHIPLIPPKEELQNISLAATSVIGDSVDPLWSLIQISQNLPSHAHALSNVTIPTALHTAARQYVSSISGLRQYHLDGVFEFYINGRKMNVDRPSFNLFELLNVLKEENAFLNNIQNVMSGFLPTKESMGVAASLVSMGKDSFDSLVHNIDDAAGTGDDDVHDDDADDEEEMMARMGIKKEKSLRIDVGRGWKGAIMYLNDIEKDPEYSDWPLDIQRVLMGVQFGRPPTIRKNMITILLVIDPFDSNLEGYLMSLSLVFQMIQGMYPVRIGLLFASEQDMQTCKKYNHDSNGEDNGYCLEQIYQGREKDILKRDSSAQTMFTLLQEVLESYGTGIAINYLFTIMQKLGEDRSNTMTNEIFLRLHKQTLSRFGISIDDAEMMKILKNSEESESSSTTYEKAVKFAVSKNIKPGMGFINGLPFSTDEPNEAQSMFQNEMNYLLGMIMTGKMTITKKSSVYAKVLTGPNVHKQMHPILIEEPTYQLTPSFYDEETINILGNDDTNGHPKILVEAIVDYTKKEGVKFTESFLSNIKKLIEKGDDTKKIAISYRVLPADKDSVATILGKVFRQSNTFDIDDLIEISAAVSQAFVDGKQVTNLDSLSSVKGPLKNKLETMLMKSEECAALPWSGLESGTIRVNGRTLQAEVPSIEDLELMIDLEIKTAKIVTHKLAEFEMKNMSSFAAISRLASFLGQTYSSSNGKSIQRSDALAPYAELLAAEKSSQEDWFFYSWNEKETDSNDIKVEVTAILDPVAEATQRAAPLIQTLRDDFKLPINLLLIPRMEITEDSKIPISTYYRFVASSLDSLNGSNTPRALFQGLPTNQILTIRMDVPEPWDIQQGKVLQDTDNLRCNHESCGDTSFAALKSGKSVPSDSDEVHLTNVEYNLNGLLFFGQCYDISDQTPPNGLQFTLSQAVSTQSQPSSGTLVMKTVGYWQLKSSPGVWQLQIAENSRGADIYEIVKGKVENADRVALADLPVLKKRTLVMKDFVNRMEIVLVKRRKGFEDAELFDEDNELDSDDDTINVFSLATGHLYERFLKIMMLSVTKRASRKVKFWFLENFLSPSFKSSAFYMAEKIGCEVEFITYKWPEWLRAQSEKQRIIWGYKILFLDVLFPLDLKKVIYVDADQVVRGDLQELVDLDLEGAPYGYTPMCESNEETKGYQFWREGFWPSHLRGKPYHISALYVVDLQRFRRELVGDQLRAIYQQLTADPNNLSNLDQDLPNFAQNQIKIHSLPQEWLWCESWCSPETKKTSKTIDLCNNPAHKEAKLSMAKRIISGELFEESWVELDEEVADYEQSYVSSL